MRELVSIIILVKDNVNFTKGCIESILENTSIVRTPYEIIVVNNGSKDGTRDYLEGLEKGNIIKSIHNETNLGFPKGNNQAAGIAEGKYLLLLNNDTVVSNGWLEKLLRCIRSDTKLAAVGPMTTHSSGLQQVPNLPPLKAYNEFVKYAEKFSCEEKYVDFLVFFCALIRRDVWDEMSVYEEI